jgi:hypothetical protein
MQSPQFNTIFVNRTNAFPASQEIIIRPSPNTILIQNKIRTGSICFTILTTIYFILFALLLIQGTNVRNWKAALTLIFGIWGVFISCTYCCCDGFYLQYVISYIVYILVNMISIIYACLSNESNKIEILCSLSFLLILTTIFLLITYVTPCNKYIHNISCDTINI